MKAPCPHARPGGCGGCDWQHATLPAQRALKAAVVAQQLRRLAGIDRQVMVEPLPGDAPPAPSTGGAVRNKRDAGPWLAHPRPVRGRPRRRRRAARHRSHRVIDIGDCLIAHQGVRDLDIPGDDWSGATAVEVAVGGADSTENFAVTVIEDAGRKQKPSTAGRGAAGTVAAGVPHARRTLVEGRAYLAERPRGASGRSAPTASGRFTRPPPTPSARPWSRRSSPKPGDTVLDLYCGAGLFAGASPRSSARTAR